jgi:vanillate O-demethylase ferredoxin subunit
MTTALIRTRVVHKRAEADGICSFELAAEDGAALPAYEPGSHIDVHVPDGPVRRYSLCGDATDPSRYRIAVLHEPASRGGSRGMHERVAEGAALQISAPRNHFPLAAAAAHHLLLAGGIGITPLLAMARSLASDGQAFTLHYATRSRERTAFEAELRASAFADRVHFHHDDGAPAQRLDLPTLLARPQPGQHLYVCGPQGFMDAVLSTARAEGWPEAQLHWEYFSAPATPTDGDSAFEVQLGRDGRVVLVPVGRSVVQALADAGVVLPTSCEQGICGTCLTGVIDGQPDHRDQYLTPEEQAACDQFLPCCSRAKSARLVLDL